MKVGLRTRPSISPLHTTFDLAREAIEEEQLVKFDLCSHCTGEQSQIDGTRLGLQAEIAFHVAIRHGIQLERSESI